MKTITTTPEFANLTEDDIQKAFDALEADPETQNPVVMELERLVEAYSARFEELCEQHDEIPSDALDFEPDTIIEQVAYDVFTEALHDSMIDADEDE